MTDDSRHTHDDHEPRVPRRTKIVATLGPVSRDERVIEQLIVAGLDIARINLSHGTLADHEASIATVRHVAARQAKPVAVLVDLPGPKLRLGDLPQPVAMHAGDTVALSAGPAGTDDGDTDAAAPAGTDEPAADAAASAGAVRRLPVNFPDLLPHLAVGDDVLVDDGAVAFRVTTASAATVVLEALNDGVVESRKGVNLPDTRLPAGALTATDRQMVEWAVHQDADFLALSFVGHADDVRELKDLITRGGGDQLVVAKIERKEALASYEEIIAAADAVMVARGDLGVEIDPSLVPVWQKRIIHAANVAGKPVITATQMLQSMIGSPRPTRAEASDVANAIYDATSAVMLSGETAVGGYPVESVQTMAGIALAVEADIELAGRAPQPWTAVRTGVSAAMSHGACQVADRVGAAAIVSATFSGATARSVARHFPSQPIVAISSNRRVVQQLTLSWGVYPLLGSCCNSFEDTVREANDLVIAHGFGRPGEVIVITAGLLTNRPGKTNLIKGHTLELNA